MEKVLPGRSLRTYWWKRSAEVMSRNSGGGLEEGNSLQDQVFSEGLREFHLQGGEIND